MNRNKRKGKNADDKHATELKVLIQTVLKSPGATKRSDRDAVYTGNDLPAQLREYVDKVKGKSYRVTDDDIDNVRAAGYSEDAIFEITTLAALGAAAQRLDAGLRAMSRAR